MLHSSGWHSCVILWRSRFKSKYTYGYLEWSFSLFYSVFHDKNQDSASKHVMTACFHIFSKLLIINYLNILCCVETVVAQWLRCCATNRKVAGSIPAGVGGFFIDIKFFWLHYAPGVDSASNRNEYQEYFLGVKAAGAYGWQPTTILCHCHEIWEP